MSTKMDEKIGRIRLRCFGPACLGVDGRPRTIAAFSRRFIFSPSRTFAGARCRTVRPLEQRVEALRPLEQGRRVRGLLRNARGHEFLGASDPDVRLDHRARACLGSGRKRGQEGQALGRSRGGFTTKIHAKSDASGDIIAFDLTGGEAPDGAHFETLLDIGPDIQPRAAIGDKGYSSKANARRRESAGIAPVIPHKANEKEQAGLLPTRRSTKPAPASSRASDGSSASSASRYAAKRPTRNFISIVSFAAGLCLIKFVHTA